jgi:hypothetical protein
VQTIRVPEDNEVTTAAYVATAFRSAAGGMLFCLVASTSSLGQANKPASFDDLLNGVKESERKLLNLRVDSKCLYLNWDSTRRDWEYNGECLLTAWYEGASSIRQRIDVHKLVSTWPEGPVPFAQRRFSSAYDGRVGQSLNLEEGAADKPHKTLEGEIAAELPFSLRGGSFRSGWACSLYGWREKVKVVFSQYLEAVHDASKSNGAVQCSVRSIRFNDMDCVSLSIQMALPQGVSQSEDWYLDPSRGYAILRYVRQGPFSGEELTVEKLIEPAPGVFYPVNATHLSKDQSGQPKAKAAYEASAVVANDPKFNEGIFTIQWPVGTFVRDKISGTSFTVGQSASSVGQAIDEQVQRVKAAVKHPLSPQPKRTGGYWIPARWLAAIAVAAVAVAWLGWWARKQRK